MKGWIIIACLALPACHKAASDHSTDGQQTATAAVQQSATAAPATAGPATGESDTGIRGVRKRSGSGDDAETIPLGAAALPQMRDCVGRCVQRNQMRAVGPEQIDADCRKSCRDHCHRSCQAAAESQGENFEKRCRDDCDRQIEKTKTAQPPIP